MKQVMTREDFSRAVEGLKIGDKIEVEYFTDVPHIHKAIGYFKEYNGMVRMGSEICVSENSPYHEIAVHENDVTRISKLETIAEE